MSFKKKGRGGGVERGKKKKCNRGMTYFDVDDFQSDFF